MQHLPRLLCLLSVLALILFPIFLTGCGGGGLATRSAGNISVHAGDNAVITLSNLESIQAADKAIDAGKVAASAANAQGGSTAGSGPAALSTGEPQLAPAPAPAAPAPRPSPAAPAQPSAPSDLSDLSAPSDGPATAVPSPPPPPAQ